MREEGRKEGITHTCSRSTMISHTRASDTLPCTSANCDRLERANTVEDTVHTPLALTASQWTVV